jgi:hypothetical protein
MSDRLMLDIETLGTEPGCAILSIGAVAFDLEGTGDTFSRSIDLESCQDAGLDIDAETLEWWLGQNDDVREVLTGGDDLETVLRDFATFYDQVDPDEIWANAPTFDCEILEAAYQRQNFPVPGSYWDERCYRTLKNLPGAVDIEREGDHDDALDDAIYQARRASATLARWSDVE